MHTTLSYCYRLKPSTEQEVVLLHALELLRRHWNYALSQHLDWLRCTRCQIDCCSLVSEPIGEIPSIVHYYTQQADLKQTKILFPEYKDIWAESQQVNLQRLKKVWECWLIPDASGRRGDRPKFKKTGKLRSFVYPRVNDKRAGAHLKDGVFKVSKIALMPVIMHRSMPSVFVLKTCTIVRKPDGWYCCISMQDETVPEAMPIDKIKSTIGINVGLKEFLVTSSKDAVLIQQHFRKAQKRLARKQKKAARAHKGSIKHKKSLNKVAREHQRIARVSQQFHYEVAHWLCKTYDLIALEKLNIKGLARTKLAKPIYDVAWESFAQILKAVGVKSGNWIVKVSSHGTSQNCSGCGKKVPKELPVRTHECHHCGNVLERDENAAINILNKALHTVGLAVPACGGLSGCTPHEAGILNHEVTYSRYKATSA